MLVDSSISKEVHNIVPYSEIDEIFRSKIIDPAPDRTEDSSIDESPEDIAFQKKYLTMESSKAREAYDPSGTNGGMSIDSSLITCPCLVISRIGNEEEQRRGMATANHLKAEYEGFWNTTHTGLLVGQRYLEVVDRIMEWLVKLNDCNYILQR